MILTLAGTDKVRVLMLGLSGIDIWSRRTDVSIVGAVNLYNEDPNDAAKVDTGNVHLYSNVDIALRDAAPDMVMMYTPNYRKTDMHAVASVVNNGYDLYLDKLRCAHPSVGDELFKLRRESSKRILIGDGYRFHPAVLETRRLLESGMAGSIESVVWECYRPEFKADWKDSYRHLMLEDLSYHHFSAMQAMFGLPFDTVYAVSAAPRRSSQNARTAVTVTAHEEDGVQLSYHASWLACGQTTSHLGQFRVEGSRGSVIFQNGQLRCLAVSGDDHIVVSLSQTRGAQTLIDHYLEMCNNQIPSELDIEHFLPVLRLVYACVQSAETTSPVLLKTT